MTQDEAIAWINEPGITRVQHNARKTLCHMTLYGYQGRITMEDFSQVEQKIAEHLVTKHLAIDAAIKQWHKDILDKLPKGPLK